jgi:hypothetical protein
VPLSIHGVYKKDTKTERKQKIKENTLKNLKIEKPHYGNPTLAKQHPQRDLGYITTTRALEPTLLVSKLIKHFKFLSPLYALSLEEETETSWRCPSSISVTCVKGVKNPLIIFFSIVTWQENYGRRSLAFSE